MEIANTNPWYDQEVEGWKFLKLSVKGGKRYLRHAIFKHEKEDGKYFERRLARAIFPNHAKVIVKTFTAAVYRSKIRRTSNDESVVKFWENIDGSGRNANAFFRNVYSKAATFGHCFVNVSRFDGVENPKSLQEQRESGTRAIAKLISPLDLIDWQLDALSNFEYAMVKEDRTAPRAFDAPASESRHQYRLWTKTDWKLFTVEVKETEDEGASAEVVYNLIDEGEHKLGVVPIYSVYLGERNDRNQPVSDSPLEDIVPMVRRLANCASLIDETIYQVTFPILQVPMEALDQLKKMGFGPAGVLGAPSGENYKYIYPPSDTVDVIQRQIDATENSIQYLSGLGRQNEQGKSASSGLALAFKTEDKRGLMEESALLMEQLETTVAKAAAAWLGNENPEIEITYKVQLQPGELDDALDSALKFESMGHVGEAKLENMVQSALARFSQLVSAERMQAILDDIKLNHETGSSSGIDSYRVANAKRVGLIVQTDEVINAVHEAVGAPVPTSEELKKHKEENEATLADNSGSNG